MWKSNDKNVMTFSLLNNKRGLSLVELVVITIIIAIIATMAFPTYKIFQQRSKEKRLKKILTDVRAAINGTKSHHSTTDFEEGFRTIVRVKGIEKITNLTPDPKERQNFISLFITKLSEGYGYPASPKEIWNNNPYADFNGIDLSYTDGSGDHLFPFINFGPEGKISLERPFYRNCDRSPGEGVASGPVHPFHDWYPTVEFRYVPAFDNNEPKLPDYSYDQWYSNEYYPGLRGVKDIVSRGVGIALDGSNTDEW